MKRLKRMSDVAVVDPSTSDGAVAVSTPGGVGFGWVLTKAHLYKASDGRGKQFTAKLRIPCDDGPACPAAPQNLGGTYADKVNNDPFWTWSAVDGRWDNWDGYACGDIGFSYRWVDVGDPDIVLATGSPVDILKSAARGNNCNMRVLVRATNRFGSTVVEGSDEPGCG